VRTLPRTPCLHRVALTACGRRLMGSSVAVSVRRPVICCDNVITIPLSAFDSEPVGHPDLATRAALDQAIRYALDIVY
jgi:hypothetical protein